jgi:hypothetical protein
MLLRLVLAEINQGVLRHLDLEGGGMGRIGMGSEGRVEGES